MLKQNSLIIILCLVIGILSFGCSSKPKNLGSCPQVGFVNGLDRLTVFDRGNNRQKPGMLFSSQMGHLWTSCNFQKKGVAVLVKFSLNSHIPMDQGATDVEVSYLVATTNPEGKILAKEIFDLDVNFSDGQTQIKSDDEFELFIPSNVRRSFEGYKILIGFKLSQSQIDYNQKMFLQSRARK